MLRIQNIRYLFLLLLLFVTALSYLPVFGNVVILEDGVNPLNRYILLLTIITFILYFDYKKWIRHGLLKRFLIYASIATIIGILLQQMEISSRYLFEARNLMISFVFLAIGYNSKMTKKMLAGLILVFSLSIGYSTYLQLLQHAGGFVITNQYISYGKNIMGIMCVSACLALIILTMQTKQKMIKIFYWAVCFFLFVLAIAIRARGSYISLLMVVVFLLYKMFKQGGYKREKIVRIIFIFIGIGLLFFLFTDAFQSFRDFFLSSLLKNREGDVLSGRGSINDHAYSFFIKNPLLGALAEDINMSSLIHNFLLRQLATFGIIGSLPIVLLYLFMAVYVIKITIKGNVNVINIGFYVFLIQLIMSIIEPSFPFAPGTGVGFSYILLGYSLYQRDLERV